MKIQKFIKNVKIILIKIKNNLWKNKNKKNKNNHLK
jgi:hypothetical protein